MTAMLRLACALVLVAACGGGGSPEPADSQQQPTDSDLPADTTANVCTMPNECPCFSNDDCPEGTRCHGDGTDVYCEPGPRGTGAAGSECTGELDCESALCVEGSDVMRCSKTCMESTECPPELPRCLGGIGICARDV
jgi:hypothetical protein